MLILYTSFWHHLPICFLKDMCRYTEGLCVPQLPACKKSICSANICNEAALTKKNFIEASTRNIPSIIFLKQVHYEYVCVIARKKCGPQYTMVLFSNKTCHIQTNALYTSWVRRKMMRLLPQIQHRQC